MRVLYNYWFELCNSSDIEQPLADQELINSFTINMLKDDLIFMIKECYNLDMTNFVMSSPEVHLSRKMYIKTKILITQQIDEKFGKIKSKDAEETMKLAMEKFESLPEDKKMNTIIEMLSESVV